jgi:hypothetical protein
MEIAQHVEAEAEYVTLVFFNERSEELRITRQNLSYEFCIFPSVHRSPFLHVQLLFRHILQAEMQKLQKKWANAAGLRSKSVVRLLIPSGGRK